MCFGASKGKNSGKNSETSQQPRASQGKGSGWLVDCKENRCVQEEGRAITRVQGLHQYGGVFCPVYAKLRFGAAFKSRIR